jgi:diacylglycerol kinase family enzyme
MNKCYSRPNEASAKDDVHTPSVVFFDSFSIPRSACRNLLWYDVCCSWSEGKVASMQVSVIINPRAGSVDPDLVEAKIRTALFRCELRFCRPRSLEEMSEFMINEMELKTDYFLICGGDGTINTCLQTLMSYATDWSKIPPIAVVKSGTANDLAYEIGISHQIDRAVRNILEGEVKNIDIIEITSGEKTCYMITNGGLGLPALTAELANDLRFGMQKVATCPKTAKLFSTAAKNAYAAVKKMGPAVYSLMAVEAIRTWKSEGWDVEIEVPGKPPIRTKAPIILISNQPSIGRKFLPAPYTSNSDGLVNLLLGEATGKSQLISSFQHLAKGTVERASNFQSFELKDFVIRSRNADRPLTFFGDGEILFKNVAELSIRCLHKGLPVVVNSWQR